MTNNKKNITYSQNVKEAIIFFSVQQYFSNNDKRTEEFFRQIINVNKFSFNDDLDTIIKELSTFLEISEISFSTTLEYVSKNIRSLSSDVTIIKKGDDIYPTMLEDTPDAPPFLFLIGNANLLSEKSVCVVGSRMASEEGKCKAEKLVNSLVKRNIVINAGLARGIDSAAHEAALKCGGKTIAVLGTPINQFYPPENKELQMKIGEEGLVVSQFPPCNKVHRWNFPLRNATMSGIALATIIVEAGETSGALKQADYALKQNHLVLIPKSAIDNDKLSWPKMYLKKGAHSFDTLRSALVLLSNNESLSSLFNNTKNGVIENVEMD